MLRVSGSTLQSQPLTTPARRHSNIVPNGDEKQIVLWYFPNVVSSKIGYENLRDDVKWFDLIRQYFFRKFSKMMFLCRKRLQNDFRTQFTFDKWFSLNASCSFLTTSWNFFLLHVWWLNNSQSCLLPPFFMFFKQFSSCYSFNFSDNFSTAVFAATI